MNDQVTDDPKPTEPRTFPWPGYIITHAKAIRAIGELLMREADLLESSSERASGSEGQSSVFLEAEVERFEINLIREALIMTHGHQTEAAKLLGVKMTTFNSKLKRFRIDPRMLIR